MEHAERNAIYNAARHGTQMEGCTLYVELLPCMDCARAIVQAGIREVVVDGHRVREYWSEQYTPHFEHIRRCSAKRAWGCGRCRRWKRASGLSRCRLEYAANPHRSRL